MKGQPSLSALYMSVFEKLQWSDFMRNNLREKNEGNYGRKGEEELWTQTCDSEVRNNSENFPWLKQMAHIGVIIRISYCS